MTQVTVNKKAGINIINFKAIEDIYPEGTAPQYILDAIKTVFSARTLTTALTPGEAIAFASLREAGFLITLES